MKSVALSLLLILPLVGCAALLTGQTDPQAVKDVLGTLNANGCVYVRAGTLVTGAGLFVAIGTYGPNAPSLTECKNALALPTQ